MPFFRKKPVVIEAIQYVYDNSGQIQEWAKRNNVHVVFKRQSEWHKDTLMIPTLEGDHLANHGDWIIKGVHGEFYPCKHDIFLKTYDAVEET